MMKLLLEIALALGILLTDQVTKYKLDGYITTALFYSAQVDQ